MSGRVKRGITAASLIEQAERSGGAYIVFSYMKRYFITQAKNRGELIRGATILHESTPKQVQTFKFNEGQRYVREERIEAVGAGRTRTATIKRYREPFKTSLAQRKADKKYRDSKSSRSSK